ncbi:hypothetical protein [Micromonospora peucetia]|uniref:Integral membrane protein n=1 Tax=Micromonospora peucetia TaxID=47871 RepID=A0ABZ1EMP7_9ACTN|nr:hypothetical protein [Micromonospora peucetia]WSA35521.1 hypothetical protein OIE14_02380 [Micromonospora peucetia]
MHRGGLALAIVTVVVSPLFAAEPARATLPTTATVPTTATLPATVVVPATVRAVASGWGAEPAPVGAPQPGPPGSRVFVEVSPSTVEPGFLIGIRASCRDNSVPATVVSDAFGRVQAQPQHGGLTAAPMVRERTRPGNYRIKLECRDGETASTMLQVVKTVKPSRGPATGFGGGSGGGVTGGILLPGGVALIVTGIVLAVRAARRPRTARGATRR